MTDHIEIDFDGDDFCPPPTEQNAIVIWEELNTKYPKFWFGDPSFKASGNYTFGIAAQKSGKQPIGTITVGEELKLWLTEIPLADVPIDLSKGTWCWALADPRSLDEFFQVMDCIYEGFHQFKEGQSLQIGNRLEIDDVLDKEQATKKLFMQAADIVGQPYQRKFIVDLQAELQNPEFSRAGPVDWQSQITTEVRENWHFLDEMTRLLFWMGAQRDGKT
jgi:hypothetical protein